MMKNRKIKGVLIGVAWLALMGVVGFVVGDKKFGNQAVREAPPRVDGTSISICSVRQTATKNGSTEWSLESSSARLQDGERQAVFENPVVTFFLKGQKNIHLRADHGKVLTDTKDIEVQGGVILKNDDYELVTHVLNYSHEKRVLSANTSVRIKGVMFDMAADSAWVDMDGGKAVFQGNVEGVISEGVTL